MNLDAEWLLFELQPHADFVGKMTREGAAESEIAAYLEQVHYQERLDAYKTAKAAR